MTRFGRQLVDSDSEGNSNSDNVIRTRAVPTLTVIPDSLLNTVDVRFWQRQILTVSDSDSDSD